MNTTDVIASSCPGTFPACIKWDFHSDNQKQLRHYPDVFVRPGGAQFGQASTSTPAISPTDLDVEPPDLRLTVTPVMGAVPLGAPVRINVELRNDGEMPVFAPSSLNLKNGLLSGTVIDPGGTARSFLPLFGCMDELPIEELAPGASVSNSITLLRGGQGALFPSAGLYRIQVLVSWDVHGIESAVLGEASVMVSAAVDEKHAEAALRVLSTPDTLLTVVLGGDHLDEGVSAIQAALDNPVLRPHYAYIEARRLSKASGKRGADPEQAARLLTGDVVMSPAERKKAATMGKGGKAAAAKGSK
jgi:hypothetical protein